MSKKLLTTQSDEQLLPIERVFPVADLGAATALVTAGFELLALDREYEHKVKFVFRREAGIEKVADDFWADRLEQKSRSFWDNARNLKNLLYSKG